ncbi:hypothetical protein TH66_18995 [Carbonactinospora thermoautotrophica]|uniref:SAM-dependent methyltransferase n=1 Tax=Carbonactinospora thermoautotrophica TaxID=1469144 RepID=A0A132MME3_9ACTN|nr:SAM-dependent methyltransferase [Carbonactinospora thermoautotrophica]KWW97640.1 hypothetical protein TH66_18995 [Carbonactinospora thermoautotrophica]KWW99024.1 hypothetical protein LI90_656 [Carbonactinospora thermoautotrophica]KWX09863.1 hypothetical protein TR74_07075 [Carbonactinospora thermoautotrophica]
MSLEERAPAGIDITRPSVARMYDYYLGGKDNFAVDREAAERVIALVPEIRTLVLENRAFLRRAVRFMVNQGIRQIIDIGSGLPTVDNTHEVAQRIVPDTRVVYVDIDPIVLAHGRAILANNEHTTVITADMRRPAEVLGHSETTRLIDFSQPVGVLLIAMLHFVSDEEGAQIMGYLRDALPSGSYLAATHITRDGKPAEVVQRILDIYAATSTPGYFRTHAEVARFFEGFELVEPGLVTLDAWRPDPSDPAPADPEAASWGYGGVGRKP